MKSSSLEKISSIYTIKLMFSHLEYNRFFYLIKYNKQIQQSLNINFKENIHLNGYIKRNTENDIGGSYSSGWVQYFLYILWSYISLFFYSLYNERYINN